jgi:hypothetical protein
VQLRTARGGPCEDSQPRSQSDQDYSLESVGTAGRQGRRVGWSEPCTPKTDAEIAVCLRSATTKTCWNMVEGKSLLVHFLTQTANWPMFSTQCCVNSCLRILRNLLVCLGSDTWIRRGRARLREVTRDTVAPTSFVAADSQTPGAATQGAVLGGGSAHNSSASECRLHGRCGTGRWWTVTWIIVQDAIWSNSRLGSA